MMTEYIFERTRELHIYIKTGANSVAGSAFGYFDPHDRKHFKISRITIEP